MRSPRWLAAIPREYRTAGDSVRRSRRSHTSAQLINIHKSGNHNTFEDYAFLIWMWLSLINHKNTFFASSFALFVVLARSESYHHPQLINSCRQRASLSSRTELSRSLGRRVVLPIGSSNLLKSIQLPALHVVDGLGREAPQSSLISAMKAFQIDRKLPLQIIIVTREQWENEETLVEVAATDSVTAIPICLWIETTFFVFIFASPPFLFDFGGKGEEWREMCAGKARTSSIILVPHAS